MESVLIVYWLIAGLTFFGSDPSPEPTAFEFIACMIVGGIALPAKIMVRWIG